MNSISVETAAVCVISIIMGALFVSLIILVDVVLSFRETSTDKFKTHEVPVMARKDGDNG